VGNPSNSRSMKASRGAGTAALQETGTYQAKGNITGRNPIGRREPSGQKARGLKGQWRGERRSYKHAQVEKERETQTRGY